MNGFEKNGETTGLEDAIAAALAAEDWSLAEELCARCRETYPDKKEGYFGAITPLLALGKYEQAHDLILEAGYRFPKAKYKHARALADVYMHANLWGMAAEVLKTAIALQSGDERTYLLCAEACCKSNSHARAESILLSAYDRFKSDNALFALAGFYTEREKWAEAKKYWDSYRARRPDSAEGYLEGCQCALHLNKEQAAQKLLLEALAAFPDNAQVALALVDARIRENDLTAACELLDPLLTPENSTPLILKDILARYKLVGDGARLKKALLLAEDVCRDQLWYQILLVEQQIAENEQEKALSRLEELRATHDLVGDPAVMQLFYELRRPDKAALLDPRFLAHRQQKEQTHAEAVAGHSRLVHAYDKTSVRFEKLSLKALDIESDGYNVRSGVRLTTDTPEQYDQTMYLFGNSKLHCTFLFDKDTFGSQMQRKLNANKQKIRVVNVTTGGSPVENIYLMFLELDFVPGDWAVFQVVPRNYSDVSYISYYREMKKQCDAQGVISKFVFFPDLGPVVHKSPIERKLNPRHTSHIAAAVRGRSHYKLVSNFNSFGFSAVDLQPLFERPHLLGETFCDMSHLSVKGCKAAVDYLYNLWFSGPPPVEPDELKKKAVQSLSRYFANRNKPFTNQLKQYIESVRQDISEHCKVGSVVMNCNPFTLGHRHLVEYAAGQVDFLYIFIVEEDLSIFPFTDRIELVKQGVAHLAGKVAVVPSGNFIISSLTFREYFSKENSMQKIDPSNDVMIFGTMIAPPLNIQHRFLGEEPTCNVTSQYNLTMARLLPEVGIQVHLIPRMERVGEPVSASRVRKYILDENYDSLGDLVPESTLRYIMNNRVKLREKLKAYP